MSYSDLDNFQHEIRLLKVLPGCDRLSDLIECKLIDKIPLARMHGRYSALSYCAGNPKNTREIVVNGIPFKAFANLVHALWEVCRFWKENYGDRELLLWADQVCINQSNMNERSHQVGFMKDIYLRAEQVFICLCANEERALGRTAPMRDNHETCRNQSVLKGLDELYKKLAPFDDDIDKNPRSRTRLYKKLDHRLMNNRFLDAWLRLYDILGSPWWSRAWVYQEFIVSSRAYFLFGSRSISWVKLSPVLSSLCSIRSEKFTKKLNSFIKTQESSISKLFRQSKRRKEFAPVKWKIINLIRRMQLAEPARGVVNFIVKSKNTWTGSGDLKTLLKHSRDCDTSELRDKVYAFIGLAHEEYAIVPDYSPSNTVVDVLIQTARRIIIFEDNLDILTHATATRGSLSGHLPSWVPDWTVRETTESRTFQKSISLPASRQASKNTKANASFEDDAYGRVGQVLKAKGILVDDLSRVIRDTYKSLRRFESSHGYTIDATNLAQTEDQLWVIYGAKSPFILRPEGKKYILISEAMVWEEDKTSNVIQGEMIDRAERREVKPRDIYII
jgi:Heterokaryon incompatibility protein (HET)